MRNYIILNGVNSNTITGLLISTLPPITKPKIRTQVEEIDGRDGDIVTKLGYSAYEKEFQIGLYGDFDINEIVSYFNSEGTVVFSNEEDKYYNYQILEQIDFEKLIKFKTANIKMHVQPFKYPTEEEQIQVDATVVTGSGSNITLEYTSLGNIITSEVDGDTQQDGTPTPDSPIAVQTVTGNQSITICGKNLYSGSDTLTNQFTYLMPIQTGETYTLSFKGSTTATTSGSSRVFLRNYAEMEHTTLIENKVVYLTSTMASYSMTLTATANGYLFIATASGISAYTFENIMLERGNKATDYEPYNSQTYSITLGSIELCKIGDYQDKIYKNEGTWYIEKQINKVVLNGSEEWSYQITNGYRTDITGIKQTTSGGEDSYILSNYYKTEKQQNLSNVDYGISNRANQSQIIIKNKDIENSTAFKTWLQSNNVSVYYALDTPTTTEITDSTLLEQLEALAGATTYENQTNITVSGSLPASLSVSTQGMPNTVINNIGNIYAKPLITIYGSGNIGVYLNQIQVLQIALGDAESITIDVATMEAYDKNTKVLMNRLVTGDYMKFLINSGDNNIAFSGNVLGFTMDNYTRWL